MKIIKEGVILYKGENIHIFRDDNGTEINFVDENLIWEPLGYISEKKLSDREVLEVLKESTDSLDEDLEWWKNARRQYIETGGNND